MLKGISVILLGVVILASVLPSTYQLITIVIFCLYNQYLWYVGIFKTKPIGYSPRRMFYRTMWTVWILIIVAVEFKMLVKLIG